LLLAVAQRKRAGAVGLYDRRGAKVDCKGKRGLFILFIFSLLKISKLNKHLPPFAFCCCWLLLLLATARLGLACCLLLAAACCWAYAQL
jgi:hypothetical protein